MPRISLSRATWFLFFLLVGSTTLIYLSASDAPLNLELLDDQDSTDIPPVIIREPSKWYDSLNPKQSPLRFKVGLVYARDGFLKGWEALHELIDDDLPSRQRGEVKRLRETHPILELVERGKRRWEKLLARQSRSLAQAVNEYTQRYGRRPPRGFDVWWQFCMDNHVKIVDDYDQIDRDIGPYFALSPELFRKRAEECASAPHSFNIFLSPTSPSSIGGERGDQLRPSVLLTLLEPIAQYLPTDLTMYISDHDLGSWLLAEDERQLAMEAISQNRYLTEEELEPLEIPNRGEIKGLLWGCPTDSLAYRNAKIRLDGERPDPIEEELTFIHDPRPTYDFCDNPSLLHEHGSLSFDVAKNTYLRPLFQWSKFNRNPEWLLTPLEAYENSTSPKGMKEYTNWDGKTIGKLFWRGTSTGDFYSQRRGYDWRESHRTRLHLMTHRLEGQSEIWVKRGKEWEKEWWANNKLNEVYMDVGLTAIHQCKEEDGTCESMREEIDLAERIEPDEAAKYKYVMDVDGNGWSSRFHRLLMSGSVVLKSTIFPEWYSDWLIPWVHYVPVKTDYSDLYTIMAFFAGSPDGRTDGYDDLARWIAEGGRRFGQEHWRWEDMQAYMLRLLLEYARLQADDREAWSY